MKNNQSNQYNLYCVHKFTSGGGERNDKDFEVDEGRKKQEYQEFQKNFAFHLFLYISFC